MSVVTSPGRRVTKIPHEYLSSNFANSSKTLAHDLDGSAHNITIMYFAVVIYHYLYCLLEPRDGSTIDRLLFMKLDDT